MDKDCHVVIPNWNGLDMIEACLDSLRRQTKSHSVIVVDNGSVDGSIAIIRDNYPEVELLEFSDNAGFAGGVNRGIRPAMEYGAKYVVLLNNDAVADPEWLEKLATAADANPKSGAVAAKILKQDGKTIDSTGDMYSIWGLPFPRGRGEVDTGQYDGEENRQIFAASGGASLYRVGALKQIGLFDERFFAYYEDSDIGFRMQLAGWQVLYESQARVLHHVGGTSSRINITGKEQLATVESTTKPSAFARYHSIKNVIYLYTKDMPGRLYWKYLPRFLVSLGVLFVNDLQRGLAGSYLRGLFIAAIHLPGILVSRHRIQSRRQISVGQVEALLYRDWPPIQKQKLASVRRKLRSLIGGKP